MWAKNWGMAVLVAGVVSMPVAAEAYPKSVIFVPTGEATEYGHGDAFVYGGTIGGQPNMWTGLNVGVVPSFGYGESGLSFGGFELGVDAASTAFVAADTFAIVNGKVQLLQETGLWPSLGVGAFAETSAAPSFGVNVGYATLTKSLQFGELELGRVHVGGGTDLPGSTGASPAGAPGFLLAGYESPAFGPVSLAIDHFGGSGQLSNTNAVVNLNVWGDINAALGYTWSNDRGAPSDSVIAYLFSGFNIFGRPAGE